MKVLFVLISIIITFSATSQELGVKSFFSLPYNQSSSGKKLVKDKRGELYKSSEQGFAIFYRNEIKPGSKWIFISELSHSFGVNLKNNRNLNQYDIPNFEKTTDIVEIKTNKTVLSVGVSREIYIKKLDLFFCPKLIINSKMFPSTDMIYEFSNGELEIDFGTNRNRIKVNPGIDFRKKIKENLTLQISIETDRLDLFKYSSSEYYINQVENVTYKYFVKYSGKFTADNILGSVGLSYNF